MPLDLSEDGMLVHLNVPEAYFHIAGLGTGNTGFSHCLPGSLVKLSR